jgi:transposase
VSAAVLSGRANGTPKDREGTVEAIRALCVVRASAVKARTQSTNQIKSPHHLTSAFRSKPSASLAT